MDTKSFISLLVVALVGTLILVGFLPMITSIQNTSGDLVTYDNPINDGNYYVRELKDGDTLEVIVTEGSNTTVKLNDVFVKTIEGGDIGGYHNLLLSDVLTVWSTSITSACQLAISTSVNIGYTNATATFVYTDGKINVQYGTTEFDTEVLTWGYVVCNESEAGYLESTRTGQYEFYLSNDKDVVCSGVYTTGENDTYYWYYNGVAHVSEDYTCSFTTNKVLVDGTSDVYKGTANFTIGNETFTPYRVLMPLEVTGHATKGALYEIFGILPLLVGVGLLLMICIEVFRRYY